MPDPWGAQTEALGAFIRSQRKLANLSLRQLAELTSLSNPYLSQIERGLHQPSVRVLKLLSNALNISAETLLAEAGLLDPDGSAGAASPGGPRCHAVRPGPGGRHPRRPAAERRAEGGLDRRIPEYASVHVAAAAHGPRRARRGMTRGGLEAVPIIQMLPPGQREEPSMPIIPI